MLWIALVAGLLLVWFLSFVVFKVTKLAIHLIVIAALVVVVIHFAARFR
jgi:hypothetical protein